MASKKRTWLIIGGVTAATAAFLYWRRRSGQLPCPSSLSFLVENPYVERYAGAELLLDRAGVEPGMRVLDVGSGPGRVAVPAAERVGAEGEVVALDVQQAMLDRVQEKVDARHLTNVRLIHAAAGENKTEPDAFDRAFLVTVLGEIPDKRAALREINRALKPEGVLSITEMLPDPDYQSPETIHQLARDTGFVVREQIGGLPAYTMNLIKAV